MEYKIWVRGFSLIELMIGLLIAMLTVAVIMQIMVFSEGQKRTTTSGSDAQINGNLALYSIERDAKNAGYGMTSNLTALGCEIRAKYGNNPTMIFSLAPVTITDGANGAPDTIQFLASSKEAGSLPTKIVVNHPQTAANFFVESDVGIFENDIMLAVPAIPSVDKWCTVFQVTNDPNPGNGNNQGGGQGQNQVLHNSGQSDWNQPGGQNIFPNGGYVIGDYLINLGALINHIYSIANVGGSQPRALQLQILSTATGASTTNELYPHIVDLQAQYGKDNGSNGGTADDGIVDGWDNTTPTNNAGWRQVLAIRFAVLARSVNWEKNVVTFNAPTWAGGTFVMTWNQNWGHYRYKVYETVTPLRNVIWHQ